MDINFLSDCVKNRWAITLAKIQGYIAVVFKSNENVLIRVFLHAKFISALKTEPKSMVFEKYAKNGKKIFIIIIFYFLRFLYKSFN